jgi:hypothetical protein
MYKEPLINGPSRRNLYSVDPETQILKYTKIVRYRRKTAMFYKQSTVSVTLSKRNLWAVYGICASSQIWLFTKFPPMGSELSTKTYFDLCVNCPYVLSYLNETCIKNVFRVPDLTFHANFSPRSLDIEENVSRSSRKVSLLSCFNEAW